MIYTSHYKDLMKSEKSLVVQISRSNAESFINKENSTKIEEQIHSKIINCKEPEEFLSKRDFLKIKEVDKTNSMFVQLLEEKLTMEITRKHQYEVENLKCALELEKGEFEQIMFKNESNLLDSADNLSSESGSSESSTEIHENKNLKQIGFNENNFLQGAYCIDPSNLPVMGYFMNEYEFSKTFTENEKAPKNIRTQSKRQVEQRGASRENGQMASKARRSDFTLVTTTRMKNVEKRSLNIPRGQDFRTFESIRREGKRIKSKTELSESQCTAIFALKWKEVTTSMLKIMKYFQRNESDQNGKNLALFCARLKKKVNPKTKKSAKEYVNRAKKVWKESQQYWKRRLKEIADLKRKKEKLEIEKKKKEEERQELFRQRKKIEFLIQRSSIYAEIMSKKLGTESQINNTHTPLIQLTENEIEEANSNVHKIISTNKNRLVEFSNHHKTVDFSHVELENESSLVEVPSTFVGKLKDYQLKGLRWLDNLYSQGINGILADEMGLGKTIQALALLCHISKNLGNYGPFMVIAPATTLFNWYSECKKFCPNLNVLPFWGSKRERKAFRRNLQQKNLGSVESEFHIVVTSYQIAVADEKFLHRINWQYIILDEAQAIKNMNSQRWYKLLELKSRNKLLLTGTPIQNTMAELWALLHFIMPQLFDSHEQFQEWFSKDIEAHSQNKQKLNKTQLDRLHAILKPFMLRRVKKDVETEIGKKHEYEIYCKLSRRQKLLYENLKGKIMITDFFCVKESRDKAKNLMNLVMQLRKVCNHPDLFERKIVRSPLVFSNTISDDAHTFYSHLQKIHILFGNINSNPLSIPSINTLFIQTKKINCNTDLFSSILEMGRLAGLPDCLALFLAKPSDKGLLSIVSSLHYLGRLSHLEKIITKNNPKLKKPVLKIVSIHRPSRFFESRIVESRQLSETISQIFVPRVWAMPIRFIGFRTSCGLVRALDHLNKQSSGRIEYPMFSTLINDSSKLSYLDKLLKTLKSKNQKTLIFCQMTKMLNIIEDYLQFRKYSYLRMDGASPVSERRDLVNEFQVNKNIFIFLLSTRAGGLGVTLTAADNVIFYDNDWNPTMDAQAADRAHRIGRRDDVHVYRLITQHTIEERIVKRAKQKNSVQQTVYSGEVFKGNVFNTHDVMSLLFDENEIKEQERKGLIVKNLEVTKLKEKSGGENIAIDNNPHKMDSSVYE